MSKIHKRVRIMTFASVVLSALTIVSLLVMTIAFGNYFGDSIANYGRFAKLVLYSILQIPNFVYPTDVFADTSFYIGVVTCAFGLFWLIFTLCKRKKSGIPFFFACILLGFVVSYAVFLFANVKYDGKTFRYFWYMLDHIDEYTGNVVIMMIFVVLALLTWVSFIVLGIHHMIYAANNYNTIRKIEAEKASEKLVIEIIPEQEKAVIYTKAPEEKHEENPKTADDTLETAKVEEPSKKQLNQEQLELEAKAKAEEDTKTKEEAKANANNEALKENKKETLKKNSEVKAKETPVKESNKVEENTAKESPKVEPKKKTTAKKVASKKVESKKVEPVKKDEPKKEESAKKDEPKKETKVQPKAEEKKAVKPSGKVYHISQHPTSDKWQVKLAKGEKALKLFNTQAEAIAYAKEISNNQGGSIRVHSMSGKIRKA